MYYNLITCIVILSYEPLVKAWLSNILAIFSDFYYLPINEDTFWS